MKNAKNSLTIVFIILYCSAGVQAQGNDEKAIDSLITEFYKALSFNDGEWKDAGKAKVFFFDEGRIVANFGKAPLPWTLKQYIANVRDVIVKQSVLAVQENEIFHTTDIFGKVAQRLSSYEVHFRTTEKETIRHGINLIQLLKVDGQWKVYSVIWDRESDQLKIPAAYKP